MTLKGILWIFFALLVLFLILGIYSALSEDQYDDGSDDDIWPPNHPGSSIY